MYPTTIIVRETIEGGLIFEWAYIRVGLYSSDYGIWGWYNNREISPQFGTFKQKYPYTHHCQMVTILQKYLISVKLVVPQLNLSFRIDQ